MAKILDDEGDEFPAHIHNFFENLNEIDQLSLIHTQIAGTTRGRKRQVQILNKSAIVLLTACFEYYVEELIKEAFNFLILNAEKHTVFPYSVLAKASNELRNDKDSRKVWELAGDGWKNILELYKNTTLQKEIDFFHVPRPVNIDDLYEKLIGINNITSNWQWKRMSNITAIETLNRFIDMRGEIAHNVKTNNSILKKDVDEYRKFLNKISVIMNNRVVSHIGNLVGKQPWPTYNYQSVR